MHRDTRNLTTDTINIVGKSLRDLWCNSSPDRNEYRTS